MRKEEAQRLLEDKSLKELFSMYRKKVSVEFENCDPLDKEALQLIRLKFDIVRDSYQELMKVINDSTIKEFEKRK